MPNSPASDALGDPSPCCAIASESRLNLVGALVSFPEGLWGVLSRYRAAQKKGKIQLSQKSSGWKGSGGVVRNLGD